VVPLNRAVLAVVAFLGLTALTPAAAQANCWPWCCLTPAAMTTVAADSFDRDVLGPNWITRGGGTLHTENGELSGAGTPSVPISYAYWNQPAPGDTQTVKATIRLNGRNPAHSAVGVTLRADPALMPTSGGTGPVGVSGVTFWVVNTQLGIMYLDPSSPNGFRPAAGTPAYARMPQLTDNSVIELRADGVIYTAYINGRQVLRGAVSSSIVPTNRRGVGVTIQDDSRVAGGGEPPANLDNWEARSG
jgi:hypothetical protein